MREVLILVTEQYAQTPNPGRPFCLFHWKLLGLFLSCRMILDIHVVLQSPKFPSKSPDHFTIISVPAFSSKERKVALCLLFFFLF